jgi:hypothetical protein
MHGFTSDFDRAKAGYSPDRIDALCFALSELLLGETCEARLEFLRRDAVKRCGELEGAKFAAMLDPKTADEGPLGLRSHCTRQGRTCIARRARGNGIPRTPRA